MIANPEMSEHVFMCYVFAIIAAQIAVPAWFALRRGRYTGEDE